MLHWGIGPRLVRWAPVGGGILSPATNSVLDVNFVTNQAYLNGSEVTLDSQITVTRSTAAWYNDIAGIWTSFAVNTLRRTNRGTIVEEARTNIVLWNRDLTNAAWVNTNTTDAKDQVGIDGVANSASSVTATGAGGTILQTTTIASSARFETAFVRRLVGTGTVEMTMDNVTWTAITPTVDWTRASLATQTIANPIVGFRLGTSGDKIAVDFVQNENGIYATTPIETTTAAQLRDTDQPVYPFAVHNVPTGTFYMDLAIDRGTSNSTAPYYINSGSAQNRHQLTTSGATVFCRYLNYSGNVNQVALDGPIVAGQRFKVASAYALDDYAHCVDGGANATDLAGAIPLSLIAPARLSAGTPNFGVWRLHRFVYWATRLTNAELQQATSGGSPASRLASDPDPGAGESTMIMLTQLQAQRLHQLRPSLVPIPDPRGGGRWIISISVLGDPAYADIHGPLSTLPQEDVNT